MTCLSGCGLARSNNPISYPVMWQLWPSPVDVVTSRGSACSSEPFKSDLHWSDCLLSRDIVASTYLNPISCVSFCRNCSIRKQTWSTLSRRLTWHTHSNPISRFPLLHQDCQPSTGVDSCPRGALASHVSHSSTQVSVAWRGARDVPAVMGHANGRALVGSVSFPAVQRCKTSKQLVGRVGRVVIFAFPQVQAVFPFAAPDTLQGFCALLRKTHQELLKLGVDVVCLWTPLHDDYATVSSSTVSSK